ncbi:MAG: NAD(P)/FAD-dependent oxidoreductase, partial [Deltaproteobacteria bacterium]|nr:NAD(P)/FAD-dependent oxidoreductase [Deltaproteobacteria bacterium]
RTRFDTMLAGSAEREGADLMFCSRVSNLVLEDGRAVGVLLESGDEVRARWTVIANGATSRLVRDSRPKRLIHTCMTWFEHVPFTPHILEMVYDPAFSPHYGWLFPESPHRVNIGICLFATRLQGRSIRDVFQEFLDKHYGKRLADASQIGRWRGHPISTTVAIDQEAPPGVLIAGEANRLTNIATGEGISYALDSGLLAAHAIRNGDENGWSPSTTSTFYTKSLRKAFGRRFKAADLFTRRGTALLDTAARLGNWGPVRSATARSLARL